jgi:hypothetical protein
VKDRSQGDLLEEFQLDLARPPGASLAVVVAEIALVLVRVYLIEEPSWATGTGPMSSWSFL